MTTGEKDRLEGLIKQAIMWRNYYRDGLHRIDAAAAALRAHALIDAYVAMGGDGSRWRKEVGVLWQ